MSANGASHDSLGFQPQVIIVTNRHERQRRVPSGAIWRFGRSMEFSDCAIWVKPINAEKLTNTGPFMERAFSAGGIGRNGNLGLKPQAVMNCAFGAGRGRRGDLCRLGAFPADRSRGCRFPGATEGSPGLRITNVGNSAVSPGNRAGSPRPDALNHPPPAMMTAAKQNPKKKCQSLTG